MLSYRHEYHVGNHADVLKHLTQIAILDYLVQKEKPLTYIDTHAGAGLYKLTGQFASKNQEYQQGIGRLNTSSHALIERYATFFDHNWYAGSVNIAQQILRPTDAIRCFELHGNDLNRLENNTNGDRRVKCFHTDGFKGLISQVPPLTKRGFILIDPSYELPADYYAIMQSLQSALQRFATGIYMVWYPLLNKSETSRLQRKLHALKIHNKPLKTLDITLQIRQRSSGMYGSGLFIINPPWPLKTQLQQILPLLCQQLGDNNSQFSITGRHL